MFILQSKQDKHNDVCILSWTNIEQTSDKHKFHIHFFEKIFI